MLSNYCRCTDISPVFDTICTFSNFFEQPFRKAEKKLLTGSWKKHKLYVRDRLFSKKKRLVLLGLQLTTVFLFTHYCRFLTSSENNQISQSFNRHRTVVRVQQIFYYNSCNMLVRIKLLQTNQNK